MSEMVKVGCTWPIRLDVHRLEPLVPAVASQPVLLTVSQAASLLRVSDRTIRRWIEAERIPFLKLPSGAYRIPQGALLASLRGTYDLAGELQRLEAKHGHLREDEIGAALDES
jgi:excisionase family DNA binding protein